MRRSAEDAARTRLALLEAALMSFEEKGWRGATFDDVAERAGVTRGAVNHHFDSKAALLVEALEWGWGEYGSRLFEREPGEATEWLTAVLVEFVALLRDDARFRALASATVMVAPQALDHDAGKGAALDAWRDRIASALESQNATDAALTARLALVILQGFTVTAVTRPDDLPQPDERGGAITALVRGLLT
ncbi:MAG: TetR/AcrR family transcriptional regulator [Actinomycetales bacterium]